MTEIGERITGKSNPALLAAASLKEKKYRRREGAFLCDGRKLLGELLASGTEIRTVWVDADRRDAVFSVLAELENSYRTDLPVRLVASSLFSKLTEEGGSEGMVTEAKMPHRWAADAPVADGERCVMLCGLQDPGNLGTVARSALAFGATRLLLTPDCVDASSPKALRASMGALLRLSVSVCSDPQKTVGELRAAGRRIYAAELRPGAVSVRSLSLSRRDVFLIGNEGHGVDPSLSALADGSVYIPIAPDAESLNAATAASVLLWQQSISED